MSLLSDSEVSSTWDRVRENGGSSLPLNLFVDGNISNFLLGASLLKSRLGIVQLGEGVQILGLEGIEDTLELVVPVVGIVSVVVGLDKSVVVSGDLAQQVVEGGGAVSDGLDNGSRLSRQTVLVLLGVVNGNFNLRKLGLQVGNGVGGIRDVSADLVNVGIGSIKSGLASSNLSVESFNLTLKESDLSTSSDIDGLEVVGPVLGISTLLTEPVKLDKKSGNLSIEVSDVSISSSDIGTRVVNVNLDGSDLSAKVINLVAESVKVVQSISPGLLGSIKSSGVVAETSSNGVKVSLSGSLAGVSSIDGTLSISEITVDLAEVSLEGGNLGPDGLNVGGQSLVGVLSGDDLLLGSALVSDGLVNSLSGRGDIGLDSVDVSGQLLDNRQEVSNGLVGVDLTLEDCLAADVLSGGGVSIPGGDNIVVVVLDLSWEVGGDIVSGRTSGEALGGEGAAGASGISRGITSGNGTDFDLVGSGCDGGRRSGSSSDNGGSGGSGSTGSCSSGGSCGGSSGSSGGSGGSSGSGNNTSWVEAAQPRWDSSSSTSETAVTNSDLDRSTPR